MYLAFKEKEYQMLNEPLNRGKGDRLQVYLVAAFWIAFVAVIAIYGDGGTKNIKTSKTHSNSKIASHESLTP